MNRNENDIRLLREDPERLLIRYQPVIRIIVRSLAYQGYLPKREISDLVQDVNRKLIERFPRISKQYNGKCLFKTYFSVVVRNLCLEEFRKLKIIAEPRADLYESSSEDITSHQLIIQQEYQRLQRALNLFQSEKSALWTAIRCLADLSVTPDHLVGFEMDPGPEAREKLASELNGSVNLQKKDKMEILSRVFNHLEKKPRNPEALRKWVTGRMDELISLMNGKPPRSAYSVETLYLLIEKSEIAEKST